MNRSMAWIVSVVVFFLTSSSVPALSKDVAVFPNLSDLVLRPPLSSILEAAGMDYDTSLFPWREEIGQRLIVRRSDSFPVEVNTARRVGGWNKKFVSGHDSIQNLAIALRDLGDAPTSMQDLQELRWFEEQWLALHEPERRVFICYSSKDEMYVDRLSTALREKSFAVFKFSRHGRATHDPSVSGSFFQSAGTHLFLDSANARRSAGVHFEAMQVRDLTLGTCKQSFVEMGNAAFLRKFTRIASTLR